MAATTATVAATTAKTSLSVDGRRFTVRFQRGQALAINTRASECAGTDGEFADCSARLEPAY
jgi:hypothetical protein